MDFKFFCPDCNQKMIMGDEFFGYPIECPHCKSKLTLLPDGPIEPVDKPGTPVAPPPRIPVGNMLPHDPEVINDFHADIPSATDNPEYKLVVVDLENAAELLNTMAKDNWYVVSQSTVSVDDKKIGRHGIIFPHKKEAVAYTFLRKKNSL